MQSFSDVLKIEILQNSRKTLGGPQLCNSFFNFLNRAQEDKEQDNFEIIQSRMFVKEDVREVERILKILREIIFGMQGPHRREVIMESSLFLQRKRICNQGGEYIWVLTKMMHWQDAKYCSRAPSLSLDSRKTTFSFFIRWWVFIRREMI